MSLSPDLLKHEISSLITGSLLLSSAQKQDFCARLESIGDVQALEEIRIVLATEWAHILDAIDCLVRESDEPEVITGVMRIIRHSDVERLRAKESIDRNRERADLNGSLQEFATI